MSKYLDEKGVQYLWSKISLGDYPNNETLVAIINAIDESKANRTDLNDYLLKKDYIQNSLGESFSMNFLLESVYPVGSIYLSINDINPANLFGFGTWEQIKDRFLLSAGDTYMGGGLVVKQHIF